MDRAPRATAFALVLALVLASVVAAGFGASPAASPLAGEVAWPPSTLVLSEVMTGGGSASDEFVEVANAGPATVDLVGLELVYVTATGSTLTRKGTWASSRPLEPGQHLLLANALGVFAPSADATYSGGLAATGGALVLRPLGGLPLDAVGWGDATNTFVEDSVAPAASAGSSIERRPGGVAGNGQDTNDNAADWFVQAVPSPQNLSAPPVPAPTSEPSATASPTAEPSATPDPTPTPTTEPTPTPTTESTPEPTPTPTPASAGAPSPSPIPTPSPTPTPTPSPTPTPTPAPLPIPIADARLLQDGTVVTIAGTLTTPLGAVEAGRGAFVQDGTAGLALYLDAIAVDAWPAGTSIEATGTIDDRFAQRTLRVMGSLVMTGTADLPTPLTTATGAAAEVDEGRRILVAGTTVGSPSEMADGTGLLVDDGTGPIRLVVSPLALGGVDMPAGTRVIGIGPLGQRDSSGTGLAGYRIHATVAGEFTVVAPDPTPTPEPTRTPDVTPSPTPDPVPTATPAATPTPAPTATPDPTSTPTPTVTPTPTRTPTPIAAARGAAIGESVFVAGTVTAEAGRLGSPRLVAIDDGSGGLVVRLPGDAASPARGRWLEVAGVLAAPYGQLEVRPNAAAIAFGEFRPIPGPLEIDGADVGEGVEARLVTLVATADAKAKKSASGDLSLVATADDGTRVRVVADASSGIATKAFDKDREYRLTGVAGQRATGKGRLDGYRIWLRDAADVVAVATPGSPSPSASASPSASPTASASPATMPIARALLVRDRPVAIVGSVTAPASLLDTSGRRIVVEDASAAVEVLLPSGVTAPSVGTRLAATGRIGRAYGAPRLRASDVELTPGGVPRSPMVVRHAPGPAHEWRLVRVSGTLVEVRRLGSRWRAELQVGGVRVPILGLSGSGIAATSLVEGRRSTITGIVRRPHPSATDRRFGIVPRSPSDVAIGPAEPAAARGKDGRDPAGRDPGARPGQTGPVDVDLDALAASIGRTVRVGGLIVDLTADGATLDDGTAVGRIVLVDEAADYLPLLEPDDAVNATGIVERRDRDVVVVVRDPAGLTRVGDLPEPAADTVSPGPSAGPVPDVLGPKAATADPLGLDLTGTAGLASLVLISLASLGVTLLRRRLGRRRLLARVAARVAGIGRPGDPGASRSSGSGSGHPDHC